jgi:hypothetical protein
MAVAKCGRAEMFTRQEAVRERQERARDKIIPRTPFPLPPSYLFPLARLHLLKFSEVAPPAGDQMSNTFHSQTIEVCAHMNKRKKTIEVHI